MRAEPNVFSLTPGAGGLKRVIAALMSGELLGVRFAEAPELLADLTVFVPHKRLKQRVEAALKVELGPRPVLLPMIRLLGAPGDPLSQLAAEDVEALNLERRVISPMERRFRLLPLVSAWRAGLGDREMEGAPEVSLRETLALAEALGRLIDEMRLSGLPLEKLASAAPPNFDEARFDDYWRLSRAFLRIAGRAWPDALKELEAVDAQAAQLERLEAEALRIERDKPDAPLLILGSTGSVAATGRLMRAISRLDHGAVVLPGLDMLLPDEDFALIAAPPETGLSLATRFAHPQATLKSTLIEIGLPRANVKLLEADPDNAARRAALSDMMRPAERVALWRESRPRLDDAAAFGGIRIIEAQDEHEEALAIALAMRETLETPGRTVALVTPDRTLSRRVTIELRRWNITALDAAGGTLRESEAGIFAQLLLDAAADKTGALMALLSHPLARFGFTQEMMQGLARALDLFVLRGHRYVAGLALATRVRHAREAGGRPAHPAVARLSDDILEALPTLAAAVDAALAPFRPGAATQPLHAFAGQLVAALDDASRDETGQTHLAQTPDGGALLALLKSIEGYETPNPLAPAALPGALALLMDEQALTPEGEEHPRAWLLGPFESRLLEADRIILGGLNEGRFPPSAPDDPFLNRAMRDDLGLPAPEWRIGASAHDFAQLAATPDLVLTRSKRAGDSPALPSRFLRRMEAHAGEAVWQEMLARGNTFIDMARQLDAPQGGGLAVTRPCPIPQVPRAPTRLNVTEIATLRRDPYALYARHLLGLVPLDPPDRPVEARDRGTLLHRILERYGAQTPPEDPVAARALLDSLAEAEFRSLQHEPELFHFWRQRFDIIADDFIAFDRKARAQGAQIEVERRGEALITLQDGTRIRLIGKADRLEIAADGRIAILDYKSGTLPSNADILKGLAPQLPLLTAMARRGAFGPHQDIRQLAHVPIGGSDPLEAKPVKHEDLAALAEENWRMTLDTLNRLSAGEEGYLAQKEPLKGLAGDYDHLTRRALWGMGGADETEETP
ncbi:MAG: double-strand break repair protein AddB [Proteobacteria bacterium]|nr:double-strand break repair protein AddB [Pseudomonadota bacterium]